MPVETLSQPTTLEVCSFLHLGPDRAYHPLTDRYLESSDPGWGALLRVIRGEIAQEALDPDLRSSLIEGRWLVPGPQDSRTAYRLKYVSLEAHTVCNQKCFFCPVSVAPREHYFMPNELYASIVSQLAAYRETIEAVFMINYNEPTLDRRFVDQVALLKGARLPVATLTNGSGFTPDRVDAVCALGGLDFLSINLSTIDPERYRRERGVDQVAQILHNLHYMEDRPVSSRMEIVVLGIEDPAHDQAFTEIAREFAGTRFEVFARRLMDRAGYLTVGDTASLEMLRLGGCENTGSRPLQHLHITPRGKCVLCCEDYDEGYVVGDLASETVDEVLRSERFAQYRRWAYGLEDAPESFICRKCTFALSR